MAIQMHVGKISASLNPLTYIIVNAGIIAVIWFGGIQVNVGDMTQGEVIALVKVYDTDIVGTCGLSKSDHNIYKSIGIGRKNQ